MSNGFDIHFPALLLLFIISNPLYVHSLHSNDCDFFIPLKNGPNCSIIFFSAGRFIEMDLQKLACIHNYSITLDCMLFDR